MKIDSYFKIIILYAGLLISLFSCYLPAKTIFQEKIKFDRNKSSNNEKTQVGANSSSLLTQKDKSIELTSAHDNIIVQIETYLNRLQEAGFSGAILVAQNGKIIFKEGYGLADKSKDIPITPATVFDTASLSKQFTAAAVLHLEQQGLLKVEDSLAKFFDDVPSDKANITIHQLLTHSSGLPEYVYKGDLAKTSRKQAVILAFDARLKFQPGTKYLYSDTGYGLLAAIVEIISGQSFQDYLQQHLFAPVGMVHTGFYNDPKWAEMTVAHGYNNKKDFGSAAKRSGPYWGLLGFGGVLTTVNDLYLWNTALSSNQILSDESIAKLFTPYIQEGDGDSYYGYGWAIQELPKYGKMIWHDGASDSQNAIFIKYSDPNNTLVVVLANRIDGGLFKKETFYGTETGLTLGKNILEKNFTDLPDYVR